MQGGVLWVAPHPIAWPVPFGEGISTSLGGRPSHLGVPWDPLPTLPHAFCSLQGQVTGCRLSVPAPGRGGAAVTHPSRPLRSLPGEHLPGHPALDSGSGSLLQFAGSPGSVGGGSGGCWQAYVLARAPPDSPHCSTRPGFGCATLHLLRALSHEGVPGCAGAGLASLPGPGLGGGQLAGR